MLNHKKYSTLLLIQLITILIAGIFSSDAWYAIIVSITGVLFNFLVSLNQPIGFLFGFMYALTNGMLAYEGQIYATFIFMLFLQAPMALYSFISWRKKKKNTETIMKKMSLRQHMISGLGMITLGIVVYFVLQMSPSTNAWIDTIFFVFSVSACLLLAFCYKSAYMITLMSGLCGTILWTYQMIQTGNGFSVAAFYVIVSINSILAVYEQYIKK